MHSSIEQRVKGVDHEGYQFVSDKAMFEFYGTTRERFMARANRGDTLEQALTAEDEYLNKEERAKAERKARREERDKRDEHKKAEREKIAQAAAVAREKLRKQQEKSEKAAAEAAKAGLSDAELVKELPKKRKYRECEDLAALEVQYYNSLVRATKDEPPMKLPKKVVRAVSDTEQFVGQRGVTYSTVIDAARELGYSKETIDAMMKAEIDAKIAKQEALQKIKQRKEKAEADERNKVYKEVWEQTLKTGKQPTEKINGKKPIIIAGEIYKSLNEACMWSGHSPEKIKQTIKVNADELINWPRRAVTINGERVCKVKEIAKRLNTTEAIVYSKLKEMWGGIQNG